MCREGCSAEEFEGLVQRNMAANCGMDYAFMAEFMRAILTRELDLLRCGDQHTAITWWSWKSLVILIAKDTGGTICMYCCAVGYVNHNYSVMT